MIKSVKMLKMTAGNDLQCTVWSTSAHGAFNLCH